MTTLKASDVVKLDETEWAMLWDYEVEGIRSDFASLIEMVKLIRMRLSVSLFEAKQATDFARDKMRASPRLLYEDYVALFDPRKKPVIFFTGREVHFTCPCGCNQTYIEQIPAEQLMIVPIENEEEEEDDEKEDTATIKMKLADLKRMVDEAKVRNARQQDGVESVPGHVWTRQTCQHDKGVYASDDGTKTYCVLCDKEMT